MESLSGATSEAIRLLAGGDTELWGIIGISFRVSTTAILLAIPPSLLIAFSPSRIPSIMQSTLEVPLVPFFGVTPSPPCQAAKIFRVKTG